MKNIKNLILLLILIFSGNSCDKSDDPKSAGEFKEGTIIYAGEFESDGCSWLIKVDTTYYFQLI